ncbi:MAG: 4'-phosphopantetheinyl transferase superfamily protein [Sulfitobacter sp.]
MTAGPTMDRLDQAQAVISALFDVPVAVGVTDPRVPQPATLEGEAAHLVQALASRQQEFAAGRTAVRIAMAQLGMAPVAIPAAKDRAPVWPSGLRGSISHTKFLCAAVVANEGPSLGLDIEQNTPLSSGLLSTICSDAEQRHIAGPDQLRLAKLVFSAKEAIYKAQYPLTKMLFGFDHIDIFFNLPARAFTATFLKPAGYFAVGDKLQGRFDEIDGHLVTAAWADKSLSKGA